MRMGGQMSDLFGRSLTGAEREQLAAWQRSDQRVKFVRARIVVLAETAPSAEAVARAVGVHVQTARDVLRTFRARGLAGLEPRPRPGLSRHFGEAATEALIALLHERPAEHGGDDGRWTLEAAAQALAPRLGVKAVSRETVRTLLRRRRYSWQQAKEWLISPDLQYARKKRGATA
jgi:transposase